MNGKPTKPSTVALLPTSSRSFPEDLADEGARRRRVELAFPLNFARSASVRIGGMEMAPPSLIWNSTPMAGSGVRMSENNITPSTPYARKGWSEISSAASGISDRSRNVGYLATRSLYTFMWRPACLIIHTGVRSTFSPRAACVNGTVSYSIAATSHRWRGEVDTEPHSE